jgi:hypothetical protein
VNYPYTFVALQPIATLVAGPTTAGGALTMSAQALMRKE